MQINLAKSSGFCGGVKKAVDTAMAAGSGTYILGELIHNSSVIKKLEEKGLITVEGMEQIPDGADVIIRSHGAPKSVYDEAQRRGINITDCTCGFVKKTRSIVIEHYEKGYQILIAGKKDHPEVVGLNGWCENQAIILENSNICDLSAYDKLCLVAQTTESAQNFEEIIKNIEKVYNKTVEIFRTICYTTVERQKEAEQLAKISEAVIVLGGFNSSNTNKLYEICKNNCKNVIRAQSPAELKYRTLTKYKKIAIVSGASTPNEQMQEVFSNMANSTQDNSTSINAVMEQALAEIDEREFKRGQIIKATISSADEEGLAVLLPLSKKETSLKKEEIDTENYNFEDYKEKEGDEIEVMVTGLNPLTVSEKAIRKMREEEALLADIEAGKEFSAVIEGSNKGGLVSKFGSYQIFIPASEIRLGFESKFDKYVGKKLRLKALEIKKDRKKEIIASQKVILAEEKAEKDRIKAEKEMAFFESIAVGDIVEGKVERFSSFGAFVSVNGFDCLAHISDLSWTNIKTPGDVLEIGKTYEFQILKINQEAKKVSIGYKQLQPEPWDTAAERYQEGDTVTGTVVRIAPFGAFVEVEKGIDALVRVSEISHEWVEEPTAYLSIGQEIEAQVMLLDTENRKMTLSIKALLPMPERAQKPASVAPRQKREKGADNMPSETEFKRPRRAKAERRFTDENEIREWNEGGIGGASIGEMLNNK